MPANCPRAGSEQPKAAASIAISTRLWPFEPNLLSFTRQSQDPLPGFRKSQEESRESPDCSVHQRPGSFELSPRTRAPQNHAAPEILPSSLWQVKPHCSEKREKEAVSAEGSSAPGWGMGAFGSGVQGNSSQPGTRSGAQGLRF